MKIIFNIIFTIFFCIVSFLIILCSSITIAPNIFKSKEYYKKINNDLDFQKIFNNNNAQFINMDFMLLGENFNLYLYIKNFQHYPKELDIYIEKNKNFLITDVIILNADKTTKSSGIPSNEELEKHQIYIKSYVKFF